MTNNIVEIHSHILPGIDDGARDVETSLKMIERLKKQGCDTIVLTPHYYSDSISLDDFLKQRDIAFRELAEALPPNSPRLIPAAEVYISKYLFSNENLSRLCIGNSNYILIEHPFSSTFSEGSYDRLMNLYCEYKIRPILAHIERYRALIEDECKLDAFIEMGCLAQANIGSFVNAPRFVRKKLFKYLESGRIHLVGSDCHNLDSRPPSFEEGFAEIKKKSSEKAIEILENNARILVK